MIPNWRQINTRNRTWCQGCLQSYTQGYVHLGSQRFLCISCYINKNVELGYLKPLPHYPYRESPFDAWEFIKSIAWEAQTGFQKAFLGLRGRLARIPLFD